MAFSFISTRGVAAAAAEPLDRKRLLLLRWLRQIDGSFYIEKKKAQQVEKKKISSKIEIKEGGKVEQKRESSSQRH